MKPIDGEGLNAWMITAIDNQLKRRISTQIIDYSYLFLGLRLLQLDPIDPRRFRTSHNHRSDRHRALGNVKMISNSLIIDQIGVVHHRDQLISIRCRVDLLEFVVFGQIQSVDSISEQSNEKSYNTDASSES